jgi:hypothetical protein
VEQEEDTVKIDMSNIFDHDPDLYVKIVWYTECQEFVIDIRLDFEKHIEVCICAQLEIVSA